MKIQAGQDHTIRITRCEVCGGSELADVLDLGSHPLCDDLVPIGDNRVCAEYPISIAFCATCKTAHQKYQVPKRTLFPDSYHYRARHTADVLNGMGQLVEACQSQLVRLNGLSVLDIGCNDGSLLSIFAENGAKTFGIEPTGAAADARAGNHTVYQDFFSEEVATRFLKEHGQPDVITFTNVFAHIEDLPNVLASLKILMSPTTLLVIENHYLGAIIERHQFDTFYHEHPRTYSLTSFGFIADVLGAKIVRCEFPARYGGNIRVMIQAAPGAALPDLASHLAHEEVFGEGLVELARRVPLWRDAKRGQLEELVAEHGPLPAKAFPGRAAILVKLLGLDTDSISAVYEKPGSMKVGCYLPGTRIPIRSDDTFAASLKKEAPLLNLAWHISAEIRAYMRKRGFEGPIIDILTQEEIDRLG
jgi:SAM-dependent methyltransferase